MTEKGFCFKQFEIRQGDCAMKVGTDGVLLGAWASLPEEGNILDIGAGTGILSLMAAQRAPQARITGIEIDEKAAQQARQNVSNSHWCDRINIVNSDFTAWAVGTEQRYAAILSNPPYFEQSLLSPDESRTTARHTTSLNYDHIFDLSRHILLPQGTLSLVIPDMLYRHINDIAMVYGWGASRYTQVRTTARKAPKRALCEWRRNHYAPCLNDTLTIHDAQGEYSQEYVALTGNFYLHF